MKFTPKTERELIEANLLKEGKADFEVVKAEEKYLEQYACYVIELTLKVWDSAGKEGTIYDSIYGTEQGIHKLLKFCGATGLFHLYETGDISPDHMVGATGKLELYTKKDKNGVLRSKVKYYIEMEKPPATLKPALSAPVKESNFIDDDLEMLDINQ